MKLIALSYLALLSLLVAGALAVRHQPRPTVPELPAREAPLARIEQPQALATMHAIWWKNQPPPSPNPTHYDVWWGSYYTDENGNKVMISTGYVVCYYDDEHMEGLDLEPGDVIHENEDAIWVTRP